MAHVDTPTTLQVRSVISADGTVIAVLSTAPGPGVVVVPGVLRRAHHYRELAGRLGRSRPVHVVERRGRGGSGPLGAGYTIEREVEDVLAVLDATGSDQVLGHSYGGLVGLHVALRRPLAALACYEPGVVLDGALDLGWIPGFARHLGRGRRTAALATMLAGIGLSGSQRFPRAAGLPLAALILLLGGRQERIDTREMVDRLGAEVGELERLASDGTRYLAVSTPTLLLAGSGGARWNHYAVRRLAELLPAATMQVIEGAGHNAPDLAPGALVPELDAFLTARQGRDTPGG